MTDPDRPGATTGGKPDRPARFFSPGPRQTRAAAPAVGQVAAPDDPDFLPPDWRWSPSRPDVYRCARCSRRVLWDPRRDNDLGGYAPHLCVGETSPA